MRHYEVRNVSDLAEWLGMDWEKFEKEYNSFKSTFEVVYDGDDVCVFMSDGDDGFAIASHSSDTYPEDGFAFKVINGYIDLPYEGMSLILKALKQEGIAKANQLETEELEWLKHHEKNLEIYNNAHD